MHGCMGACVHVCIGIFVHVCMSSCDLACMDVCVLFKMRNNQTKYISSNLLTNGMHGVDDGCVSIEPTLNCLPRRFEN